MAHFAKLNKDNIVTEVIVINNEMLLGTDNIESESNGIAFIHSLYGFYPKWIQTSYNGNIRKNFAGVGFYYDSEKDAFIPPKPFNSWVLDENTCNWIAPVEMPQDGQPYQWNEETTSWDLITL